MRMCWIFLAFSVSFPCGTSAAEVPVSSKIDAVIVFPSGAEITRLIKVKLEPGEQTLLIRDLTGEALPESIRVEASAGGRLEIGSVDARVIGLSSGDPAIAQSERKKIEDQIEALNSSRRVQEGVIQASAVQRSYLENLAKLPQTSGGAGNSAAREDWGALFGVIGNSMIEALKISEAAGTKIREIDRQLADLSTQLANAGGDGRQDRTEIRVHVSAAEPLEAELHLRYQTQTASWTPFYDGRLTIGGKEAAPTLVITRRASVQQNTGEDWDGVRLSLSTTRPGATTSAPDLRPLVVDFAAGAKLEAPGTGYLKQQQQQYNPRSDKQQSDEFDENQFDQFQRRRRATETIASARITAFQTVYSVPGRTVIRSTNEAKRLKVGAEEIKPAIMVQTAPRIDQSAYLYARLTLPATSLPFLAGQVSLFRDGVFVGNGTMPQLAPGEEHDLGFGVDERVKVKRVVLENKRGQTGTFTTSYTEERRYAIAVRNLHDRAVQVRVFDRKPIPLHQDIKVEFQAQGMQPTETDVDDQRGIIMWQVNAGAGEEKQIGFGYRLTAPAGNPILYGELGDQQEQLERLLRAAPNMN
jgi:uncharacterized protein (TIGR02231 family)